MKQLLIFCQIGFSSNCLIIHIVKSLGFKVVVEYIDFTEIINSIVSDVTEPHLSVLGHHLADFDMVILLVCENKLFAKDFIIPEELVTRFKQKINLIKTQKATPLYLVGINPYLSEEKLQKQSDLFNGLFISGRKSALEYEKFFERVFQQKL